MVLKRSGGPALGQVLGQKYIACGDIKRTRFLTVDQRWLFRDISMKSAQEFIFSSFSLMVKLLNRSFRKWYSRYIQIHGCKTTVCLMAYKNGAKTAFLDLKPGSRNPGYKYNYIYTWTWCPDFQIVTTLKAIIFYSKYYFHWHLHKNTYTQKVIKITYLGEIMSVELFKFHFIFLKFFMLQNLKLTFILL